MRGRCCGVYLDGQDAQWVSRCVLQVDILITVSAGQGTREKRAAVITNRRIPHDAD